MNNGHTELVFSLYSRPECHLCDEMLNAMEKWKEHFKFKVDIFNIDDDPDLTARYAARIPLLAMDDDEICEYHFDEASFLRFLREKI